MSYPFRRFQLSHRTKSLVPLIERFSRPFPALVPVPSTAVYNHTSLPPPYSLSPPSGRFTDSLVACSPLDSPGSWVSNCRCNLHRTRLWCCDILSLLHAVTATLTHIPNLSGEILLCYKFQCRAPMTPESMSLSSVKNPSRPECAVWVLVLHLLVLLATSLS